jgi:hypothetical protein
MVSEDARKGANQSNYYKETHNNETMELYEIKVGGMTPTLN